MAQFAKSSFSHASYAAFRPSYPTSLYDNILTYHQGPRALCADLGSGHGLVARALAPSFTEVIGIDPSQGMIGQAKASTSSAEFPNVSFLQSSAERLPFLQDESVDMIVAGQAAHWFDLARLWPEMKRVVRKDGTLAFWGYKDPVFPDFPKATKVFYDYAYGRSEDMLGPYWEQPGRSRVQNKLRDLKPPGSEWDHIERVEYEPGTEGPRTGEGTLLVHDRIKIGECMNYVRTWSSFSGWQEQHPQRERKDAGGQGDVVDEMFASMRNAEVEWQGEGWKEKEVEMELGSGILMARRQ